MRAAIDSHRRVDVRGSRGSGKSVALARLVMRAREAGWVVAYLPDCLELTRFSFFSKSTKEGCEGMWDTPDCAVRVLKHIANASNEEVLKSVKVHGVMLPQEQSQKGKGKRRRRRKRPRRMWTCSNTPRRARATPTSRSIARSPC